MIYFRDKEYVQPVNILNEKEAYKGHSLETALEKIQKDFNEYKKIHKDGTIQDYIQHIYDNPQNYIQTTTDPSVNTQYVEENPDNSIQMSIDQSVTTITTNTEAVAKQLKNEDVMVNNGQITLEQYNFLNN